MMDRTIIKPLLPDLRREILNGIERQIGELSSIGVEQNALVKSQKARLAILHNLIERLPDGYPIPIVKD